jgi:hypothetical protein
MTARYLRQVAGDEPCDPTMTAVADLRVFRPGDVLHCANGYRLIVGLEPIDDRTLLAHLLPIPAPLDGVQVHDLRNHDGHNFRLAS